jgi:hypothetical protein
VFRKRKTIWTGVGLNPELRGKMPATNRLRHGTAVWACSLCIIVSPFWYTVHHTYIIDILVYTILDRGVAEAVSRTAEDLFRSQTSKACGGQSDTGAGFRLSVSLEQCFILILHLPPTLNNFNYWKLR